MFVQKWLEIPLSIFHLSSWPHYANVTTSPPWDSEKASISNWMYFSAEKNQEHLSKEEGERELWVETSSDLTEVLGLLRIHPPGQGQLARCLLTWLCPHSLASSRPTASFFF